MKSPSALALAVVTMLCGAAAGFYVGANRDGYVASVEAEGLAVRGESASRAGGGRVEVFEAMAARVGFTERAQGALAEGSVRKKAYEIERLFEGLRAEDAPALLEEILAWPDGRERRGMLPAFFERWGELDGPVALAAAESMAGRDKSNALSAAYAGWAMVEPRAAWEKAKVFVAESSPYAAYTVRGVVSELAKVDVDAVLGIMSEEKNAARQRALSQAVLEGVFEAGHVEELIGKLGGIEDFDTKKQLMNSVFRRWGESDSEDPMAALAGLKDPVLAEAAMGGFLEGWVNEDREGALRFALESRDDPLIANSLGDLLRSAVHRGNAAENAQLVADVEAAGILDEVAQKLVGAAAFSDPQFALQIAEKVTDEKERSGYVHMAISHLARSDVDGAISYFSEKIAVADKSRLMSTIAMHLQERPDGGAKLIQLFQQLPEGRDTTRAVELLLMRATSRDAKLSDDYLRSLEAVTGMVGELSKQSKEALEKLFGSGQ